MKPNETYIFKPVGGIWKDVAVDSGTLADTLTRLEIIIDDSTQFCRLIRYYDEYQETITYRAYNNAKITITINRRKYDKRRMDKNSKRERLFANKWV